MDKLSELQKERDLLYIIALGCNLHPSYRAKSTKQPYSNCPSCVAMWKAAQELRKEKKWQ